jgi:hypothetical protein
MNIIKYEGQNAIYLNQDKYRSKGISCSQNVPEKQYFKQLLVACFCNTLHSVGITTKGKG